MDDRTESVLHTLSIRSASFPSKFARNGLTFLDSTRRCYELRCWKFEACSLRIIRGVLIPSAIKIQW